MRPLPRYAALIATAALTVALGSLGSRAGLATLTDQAQITGNTFASAACFSGDTGFLDPTAQAADTGGDGDGFEVNPTNAFADGGGYAQNVNGPGDRHRYYGYGMSVGPGCSITGIEVRLDWWLGTTLDMNSMSVELSWDGGASWTAAKTDTVESSSEHTTVLGGSNDTWGRTWTPAELDDASFRVRLTSNCLGGFCGFRDFFLDWVPVRVYYGIVTPTTAPTITPTATLTPTTTLTPTHTITPTPTMTPTLTPTPSCSAGDTGLVNPTAQAADTGGDGDGFELNPTGAFADGGGYAQNVNGPGDRHRYYGYGMSVGPGCSITGIEVRLDWWLSTTLDMNSMSVELSWDGGASWTAAKTDTVESSSEHTTVLGGSNDTWGRIWTPAELNDASFRVRLTSNCLGGLCGLRDFFLDWVPVRVYYGP